MDAPQIDQVPFHTRVPAEYEVMYAGTPPWEIGAPQHAFAELAELGALRGSVLDIGCGTGEHALMAAARGMRATGVDSSSTAIEIARAKAERRGVRARFEVMDVFDVATLDEQFDTVLDSGLFHTLDDDQRARYSSVLQQVVSPNGRVLILCFSERQPGILGPRRVSEADLRETFAREWNVEQIDRATIDSTEGRGAVEAWLAVLTPGVWR